TLYGINVDAFPECPRRIKSFSRLLKLAVANRIISILESLVYCLHKKPGRVVIRFAMDMNKYVRIVENALSHFSSSYPQSFYSKRQWSGLPRRGLEEHFC
ncbi:6786_t:CDS:1, partial [Ambispora gerdemannii]